MTLIYLNGNFVAEAEAHIPVADRGFRFGDGVFETIRIHRGRPYQWAFHRERLAAGLYALRIAYAPVPLEAALPELVAANGLQEGFVRIAVSRGSGSAGYLPLAGAVPSVVMETLKLREEPAAPLALRLSEREKISPRALPSFCKTAQGLSSTLARLEAADHGCSDALLLTAEGSVCETSSANLFWLKGGTLYTPALSTGALPGSMRHAVLRLSPWPVAEVEAPLSALQDADALIATNCNLLARGVARLEPQGWIWQSEDAAAKLRARITEDMAQECAH